MIYYSIDLYIVGLIVIYIPFGIYAHIPHKWYIFWGKKCLYYLFKKARKTLYRTSYIYQDSYMSNWYIYNLSYMSSFDDCHFWLSETLMHKIYHRCTRVNKSNILNLNDIRINYALVQLPSIFSFTRLSLNAWNYF